MPRRPFALLVTLISIFALLTLAACGDDSTSPATTTAAPSAAATSAATEAASAAPSAAAPAETYPLTVTDLLGRQVEIKAKPTTVVALSPTAVEFVYAAGATVVGRTDTATYPDAAQSAEVIGSAYSPAFDKVLALKPDLVVADSVIDAQPQLKDAITNLGVPVIFAGADSYQKVLDGLNLMGQIFDAKATTDAVVAQVQKARDDAHAAVADKGLSAVALIMDQDKTIYAAKSDSYVGDILKQAGITNPADPLPDSGPFPGYTTLPPEKLVEFNPDFIFTISPGAPPAPLLSTVLPSIPSLSSLTAVTTPGHLVEIPVKLVLEAPGPRIVDAFKAIEDAAAGNGSAN